MIWFAIGCFVIGVLLMVVFDLIWLGVILLFAFIVAGVFVIADPEFLVQDFSSGKSASENPPD